MSARASLPQADWPASDRDALDRALRHEDGLFGRPVEGELPRPATVRNYAYSWGHFLASLARHGDLHPAETPGQRVTRERVARWVRDQVAAGAAPTTLRQHLVNTHAFLGLVAPGQDFGFLRRPGGVRLRRAIPGGPRQFPPRDTAEVLDRVRALHREALAMPDGPGRWRALRDAACIALIATRGPRVGSVAEMELGRHLRADADGLWHARLGPAVQKNKALAECPLDPETSAMMEDHLVLARPRFPRAAGSNVVWLGMKGPMTVEGIQKLHCDRTLAWFGEAAGPHASRRWLRTTLARRHPDLVWDAALVIGHTPETAAAHYAEASSLHAALRHGRRIDRLRRAAGTGR